MDRWMLKVHVTWNQMLLTTISIIYQSAINLVMWHKMLYTLAKRVSWFILCGNLLTSKVLHFKFWWPSVAQHFFVLIVVMVVMVVMVVGGWWFYCRLTSVERYAFYNWEVGKHFAFVNIRQIFSVSERIKSSKILSKRLIFQVGNEVWCVTLNDLPTKLQFVFLYNCNLKFVSSECPVQLCNIFIWHLARGRIQQAGTSNSAQGDIQSISGLNDEHFPK
jgi:hypothetical protein